ncbi:MAG: regulatory protein RecX [Firmicutes bacterium]|nr:regulatory protein RecX [Bacillota bacterium]
MTKGKNKIEAAALRLLTYRDRSVQELRDRLNRRFEPAEVESVLAHLKELGYLDDLRFARNYVDSRNRNRPRGNYLLRLELGRKGIADAVIEEVLNSQEEEYQLAFLLAQERFKSLEKVEEPKRLRRLYSLLQRRGFPWSIARRAVGELLDSDPQKEYN